MSKIGRTRHVIHFGILIAAIIAGAFTVASVFAEDPPALPDFSCINGKTLSCDPANASNCRIICEAKSWEICAADNKGATVLNASYICNTNTYWKKCIGTTGEVIEGKICTDSKWVVPQGAALCDNDGVKDAIEECDFGAARNNGTVKSSTETIFTLFVMPPYASEGAGYTCDSNCKSDMTLFYGGDCGDAKTNGAEQCDSSLNCNNVTCTCNVGFISQLVAPAPVDDPTRKTCVPPQNLCGNNQKDGVEACDGGSNCTDLCVCEDGYIPGFPANEDPQPGAAPACRLAAAAELCGNGQRDAGEQCDKDGGQHCSNTCQCSAGYEPIPNSHNSLNCQLIEEDDEDDEKQCDDNEDNDDDGKEDYPADPGCSSKNDNSEVDAPKGALKILEAEIFPVGFNPNSTETEITYELSGDGIVELTILDESGVKVVTLIDNEEIGGNTVYHISWDGTDEAEGGGKLVDPGKYFFKLTVKASEEGDVSDTKTGEINVIYAKDFEGIGVGSAEGTGSGFSASDSSNGSVSVMHNTPPKNTSGTGPETAIYLLLPLVGFIGVRYAHRKK